MFGIKTGFVGVLTALQIMVIALHANESFAQKPDTMASVIMYHRFGESDYPSTNVTMAQFAAHVAELKSGDYHVADVGDIVAALRDGKSLPEKTVGLSVDDAYLSVYEKAWPVLRDAGYPLTIFVATDPIDQKTPGYMSWAQLRELQAEGVTIGSQTKSHPHMTKLSDSALRDEIAHSNARFEAELGKKPTLFAYPYGESDLTVETYLRQIGFTAGFGQHSGAIGTGADLFSLPRFSMNEAFGSLDRFKLAVNALPVRVSDATPMDRVVGTPNPPLPGFTVVWPKKGLDRLTCYVSHEGRVAHMTLGSRVEIRMTKALPRGRTRLNCTLPAGNGRWHWYGRQFLVE